jgi:membrane-bound ClpP family serine protease
MENIQSNMNGIDRVIRTLLGVIGIILFMTDIISGTLGVIVLMLSVIFILTALVKFCPIYTMLGIKTSKS